MEIMNIIAHDKVLVIAPHPDDESIGCGGLLLKYAFQCDVLCITDGKQGQGDINPSELELIRRNEFNIAMDYAKLHSWKMLGIADGTLCAHLDVLEKVDLSGYSKIFVTGPEDRHPDHTAALTVLKRACIKQDIEPEIYVYEVHRKLKCVTHLLFIGDVLEKKKELMRFYFSQMRNGLFDNTIIGINQERGVNGEFCEGFRRMNLREIPDEIPLDTEIAKMREYYWVYTRWMRALQSGGGIASILKKMGYQSVMIYGFKELGQLLFNELIDADIKVSLIVDKRQSLSAEGIATVYPKNIPDNLKNIPIVVTATWYIDEIRSELCENGICDIISIKDLLESNCFIQENA